MFIILIVFIIGLIGGYLIATSFSKDDYYDDNDDDDTLPPNIRF